MEFKNSKLKLYFNNNGSLMTLKKEYSATYKFVEDLYTEIAEKYTDLNKNKTGPITSMFAEYVKIYLTDEAFSKIRSELKVPKTKSEIKFGFSTSMTLFTLCDQSIKTQDQAIKKSLKSSKMGFDYTNEI